MDFENEKSLLIYLVENIEEKFSSIKLVHEKLFELINILSQTHENIFEELIQIKTILNQHKLNENKNRKLNIDSIKELNSNSPTTSYRTDRLSLFSPTSFNSSSTNSLNNDNRPNSSTSKRSSNLKKSNQSSIRPKSVTFNFDQDENNEQQIEICKSSNETIKENVDLIPNLFEQHHHLVTNKPSIGFKLGKYV
jgi:hypothetical protein